MALRDPWSWRPLGNTILESLMLCKVELLG
jgi:hypothetical protein